MILSIYGKVNYILQMQYSGQNDEPGPDNRRYDSSIDDTTAQSLSSRPILNLCKRRPRALQIEE